jgi:Predicted transcriptional regulator
MLPSGLRWPYVLRRKDNYNFGERELDVMEALWAFGPGTIGDIHLALSAKGIDIAYTTVQTMLNRLEKKGALRRRIKDGVFHYSPVVTRTIVIQSAVRRIADRFLGRAAKAVIAQLVEDDLTEDDLNDIQRLIEKKKADRP